MLMSFRINKKTPRPFRYLKKTNPSSLKEVHPENAYFIRKKKKGHFRIDPEGANALKSHTELFDCKYRIDPIATPSL
jgi:hypothetical protein